MAIRVELELIDGSFTTRMMHAGESIDQFNRAVARAHPQVARLAQATGGLTFRSFHQADIAAKGFVETLRDYSVVLGAATLAVSMLQQVMGGLVGEIVQVNAQFERLTKMLAGMSTAADPMADARAQMQQYQQLAKEIPLSQEAILNGAIKLRSVGIDPLNGSLRQVADAVSQFGGGEEQFNRTLLAITQMSGKGVIQMEELRQQLGEAVPRATELMARAMGVSYAELIKRVGAGNVEAKRSLQLLLLEFERTFGGASLRMMSTYDGQVQVLKTNLQQLAQAVGGDFMDPNSFFGTIKTQLADINFFLSGPQAKQFAADLGQGMRQAVIFIRQVIETVIEWKSELISLGTIIAATFGLQLIGRFTVSMVNGFAAMGAAVQAFQGKWQIFMAEWRRASIAGNLASALAGGMTGSLMNAGIRLGSLGSMLPAIALGMTNLITLLPALGIGLWAVAEYFDLFGDNAKRAWEELRNMNVTSVAKIKELQPLLDEKKKELAELEAMEGKTQTFGTRVGTVSRVVNNSGRIAELKKELAQMQGEFDKAMSNAVAEDARKIKSDMQQLIGDKLQVMQSGYDKEIIAVNESFNERAEAELAAGRSSANIEAERQKKLREIQLKADRIKMDWLKQQVREQQKIITGSLNKTLIDAASQRLQVLQEQLVRVQNTYSTTLGLQTGVPEVAGTDNSEKKEGKARTLLGDLREQAGGLRNELVGGSNAMGELLAKIEAGDYGDLNVASVREYVQELINAQSEVDNLREAVEYMTDSQDLFDKTLGDIQDKTFEYQTEGMNEIDKYVARQQRLAQNVSPGGRMALMMVDLKAKIDQTNGSLGTMITGFTERLFGTDTANKGQTVVGILQSMLQYTQGITGAINGMQFNASGAAGMSFTGPRLSGPTIQQAVQDGFLALLGAAEGTDKGRGYNETLAYGAFTGGPVDLVSMTLREVMELQRQMLANPANTWNSSAVGRYQITRQTLQDFMGQLGLSPDTKFTPDIQDQLARAIFESTGGDMGRLRGRWEGLKRVDDATISASIGNGMYGGTGLPNSVRDANGQVMEAYQQIERLTQALIEQGDAAVASEIRKYGQEIEQVTAKTKGLEDAEVELRQRIRDGKLSDVNRDPDSPYYEKTFQTLRKLIDARKEYDQVKEAKGDVNNALERSQQNVLEAERELQQVLNEANQNPYAAQQDGLQKLIDQYDILLEKAKLAYGAESTQFKALYAEKEQVTKLYQQRDFNATLTFLKDKQKTYAQENMSEAQRAKTGIDDQIAEIQRYVTNFKGSEAERVRITAQAEAAIAELRKKGAQSAGGAFQQQMKQWSDLSGNLSQLMANAANSLADGLTSMLMGEEVDWQQMLRNMLKDLVNMGIKYLMSSLMGGKGQVAGMMGGKGGKGGFGGKAAMGGKGKGAFGVAHTGGIVGRLSGSKMVNPMAFAGAPRFHAGGMVKGMGLGPDEVPIIARKGEGVFTPDQMAAMANGGANRSMAVNTNVTVNAQGGDSKQNGDLAKQVAREVENSVRGIVYKEMRAQMRPGNMMNR